MKLIQRLTPAEGLPTVALLMALLWTTLHAIDAAGWGDRVYLAPRLAVLGVLIGLIGAKGPIRSAWGLLLGLAIGFQATLLTHAATGPDPTWEGRLNWLSERLSVWLQAALNRGASHDPLVFAVVIGAIGYLLGLCSAWLVFRLQNGWWPLVIAASVGLIHLSYATTDSLPNYLISILIGALLVASLELHLRRSHWEAIGVPVRTASSTFWTLTVAGGLAGLATAAAFQLPSGQVDAVLAARYDALTEPWQGLQQQVDRLVGGARGQSRPGGGLIFSESLMPRESFDLGSQPLLKIVSPEGRYWRAATYDRYDGRSMASIDVVERHYGAEQELPLDQDGLERRQAIEQRVTVLAPGASVLFAADAPRSFSIPVVVGFREPGWDHAGYRPATAIERGQSYTVTSMVPQVSLRELAGGSRAYPEWIDRYLELPTSLPARVGALGNQIASDRVSPLEKALAIESYLRGLTYSTHTSIPPVDRDWVDYFLFDSRTGYCDYFATSMVVLLRSQGIPARVASGFAPGTYDPQEQAWLVRESDAHSWVEAYFPSYGWQTFEPSAIRTTPQRFEAQRDQGGSPSARQPSDQSPRSGPAEEPLDGPIGGAAFPALPALQGPSPVGVALGLLGILVLGLGLALGAVAWLWERGLESEPVARRRFAQLRRALRWGGWNQPDSLTQYELGEAMVRDVSLPQEPVRELVHRYVLSTFDPSPNRVDTDKAAETAWQQLRRPLAVAVLRGRLRQLLGGAGGRRGPPKLPYHLP